MKKFYEIKSETRVLNDYVTLDVNEAMNTLEDVKPFVEDDWYTFSITIEGTCRITTLELSYESFKDILEYDYLQTIL